MTHDELYANPERNDPETPYINGLAAGDGETASWKNREEDPKATSPGQTGPGKVLERSNALHMSQNQRARRNRHILRPSV